MHETNIIFHSYKVSKMLNLYGDIGKSCFAIFSELPLICVYRLVFQLYTIYIIFIAFSFKICLTYYPESWALRQSTYTACTEFLQE